MFNDPNKLKILLIAALVFGLVLSVWVALLLIWRSRRLARDSVIEQRIGLVGQVTAQGRVLRLWREGNEATTLVPGSPQLTLRQWMEGLIQDAGWTVSVQSVLLRLLAVCALVPVLSLAISFNPLTLIGGPLAVVVLFWIYLNHRIAKRASIFEMQFADCLELAARSLRVGHPLVGAFQLIAEEFDAPVGPLFGAICQQQALGRSVDDALRTASAQRASEDLKLFAAAVIIQLRSGGSLAEMMERLAVVIRERIRLARRVRVLTAQTQFSKRVLQALPLLVFVLINLVNADYMRPLYQTDAGRKVLMTAFVCLLLGSWLMNRLAVIRY